MQHDPACRMDDFDRACGYLQIALVPGITARARQRLLKLVRSHGHVRDMCSLDATELQHVGVPEAAARQLVDPRNVEVAHDEWRRAQSQGIRILDLDHPDYPQLLRETSDPPTAIYVRGQVWNPPAPHIAIVGSRKPTAYGLNCAERLSSDLAATGAVIVSGLARGIDSAAHRGALHHGTTIAVLGTGVDRTYPVENRSLADKIFERGALASEYPLGTPPLPQNFPRRNRILAGLALGTLVVEATERSGSLITARFALEANREVFAVPGPATSARSRGCHDLIRHGACLVTGWEDIARELAPKVTLMSPAADDEPPVESMSADQVEVLRALSISEEIGIDELLRRLPISASRLYTALLDLELGGRIRTLAGERYIRVSVKRKT